MSPEAKTLTGLMNNEAENGTLSAKNLSEDQALRRSIPCFFSQTSRMEIAAGVTPEMRDA
ncbi:Uncharacterised protein [Raoultella terrigena]|nr:Uncharacterised protein [Raoultella terrigena]